MPVKLTDSPLFQMLLGTGDVMARRKIRDHLLPNPASVQQTGLGVRERPFEVWDASSIGFLLAKVVGVLPVPLIVGASCAME